MNLETGRRERGGSRRWRPSLPRAERGPGDGVSGARVSRTFSPRARPPGSPRQVKGRGRGARAGCPRARTGGRSAGRGRLRRALGGARRPRSLGRLSGGCCRWAAAATVPAAPSAGGRGHGWPRLLPASWSARLTPRGRGSAGLPRLGGRPRPRPRSAGTCLRRGEPADSDPRAGSALPPCHPTTSRAHPPSSHASHFPCSEFSPDTLGDRGVCMCACVCECV